MAERKIAILGSAQTTLGEAPMEDDSWEIWCSAPPLLDVVPRLDRWVEVHCPKMLKERLPEHYGNLSSLDDRLWTIHECDEWSNAHIINKPGIENQFDPYWLTSSIAWMMAMALIDGVDEIGLYGVEMAMGSEYEHQRPGVKHLIHLARDSGIDVHIPPRSELSSVAMSYPSNYESNHAMDLIMREEDNLVAMSRLEDELQQVLSVLNQTWGEKSLNSKYKGEIPNSKWTEVNNSIDERLRQISIARTSTESEIVRVKAQLGEIRSLMRRYNIRINRDE